MAENILPNNSKRIAKNTLFLYIRTFITMFISLYTSRVILEVLGIDDFGIYNVVGGFVGMFSLISATLTSSTQRFITFELGKKGKNNSQDVFSSAILIHVIIAFIIIILAESIGVYFLNTQMNIPLSRLTAANWIFQFSLITFVVNIVSIPYNSTIIAHERMTAFASITLIEALLKLLIVYMLKLSTFDKLIVYGILILSVSLVIRIVYGVYCSRNFVECKFRLVKKNLYYKQILGFSGWNIIGTSSSVLATYGINVLLNIFFGVAVNAARGIAAQVDNAVSQFVGNFIMAINPKITKSYASGDREYMIKLVVSGSRYSFYLLFIMVIPILFETEYVLTLWLRNVPEYTVVFVQLSLIYMLCQSLSNTLFTAMLATGNIRNYQIVVGGLALMAFPLSYALFKMGFAPSYCYYISIFISVSCLIARLVMLQRMIGLPMHIFLKDVVLRVLFVSILSLVIPCLIINLMPQGFVRLMVLSFVSLMTISIVILYIGITKNERVFLITYIKNKIHKK